ncbi:MAG: DUF504 domain-containing protein [Thermoplasmata archaeon]|nr:MAG: DUF504 domain-containing protein [Thermoplasmata archaeon]
MPTAKNVLNEYKWRDDRDFNALQVVYIHRGAKGDLKTVEGADITTLGNSFFKTTTAEIPYHRIVQIRYKQNTIWKRTNNNANKN